jgi:hypothetical protein
MKIRKEPGLLTLQKVNQQCLLRMGNVPKLGLPGVVENDAFNLLANYEIPR